VHAADDWDIPSEHSDTLFDAVLSPHLPALPDAPSKHANDAVWTAAHEARILRQEKREELVHAEDIPGLGHIEEYGAARLLQVRYGGHDPFRQEAVQDTLREYLKL
jgi:abhydrolase domain-containing protein 12